jgi:hypothetical protein
MGTLGAKVLNSDPPEDLFQKADLKPIFNLKSQSKN